MGEIWLVRHGETEWSLKGQHTGKTDLPLTPRGEQRALLLGPALASKDFALVLTSPLRRARETTRLAGFGERAEVCADLREWDYGVFEGRTTDEIRKERPGWSVWDTDVPGGESIEDVAARTSNVIARAESAGGDVLLFAHGHSLRILTAGWLGLEPRAARLFALAPGTISVLGHEHGRRVMRVWNREP